MKKLLKVGVASALGIIALAGVANTKKENVRFSEINAVADLNIKRHTTVINPFSDEPKYNEQLYWNVPKDFSMKKNYVYQFQFVAHKKAYYIFEALSDVKTNLCVDTAEKRAIYDTGEEKKMDGNKSKNAKIRMELDECEKATIYVKTGTELRDPQESIVRMSIKTASISIVTNNCYEYGNTQDNHKNNLKFYNNAAQNFFERYPLQLHSDVSANDVINNNFYKNEVMGFWGGAYMNRPFDDAYLFWNREYFNFTKEEFDFKGTSLTIWAAFGSANDEKNDLYTVARQAHLKGAKCSIGLVRNKYTDEITLNLELYFLVRLLNYLAQPGITVRQAVEECEAFIPLASLEEQPNTMNPDELGEGHIEDSTSQLIYECWINWYKAKPVRIYGDADFTLIGNTKSNGVFSLENDFFHNPGNPGKIDWR